MRLFNRRLQKERSTIWHSRVQTCFRDNLAKIWRENICSQWRPGHSSPFCWLLLCAAISSLWPCEFFQSRRLRVRFCVHVLSYWAVFPVARRVVLFGCSSVASFRSGLMDRFEGLSLMFAASSGSFYVCPSKPFGVIWLFDFRFLPP